MQSGDLEILTFSFLTGCQVFVRDAYLGWILYSNPFFQNEVSIYLLQNFHYQPISGHNRIPVFYPIPQVSSNRVPTKPSVNQCCSAFASNSSEISNVRSDVTKQAIYYRKYKDKINQKRRQNYHAKKIAIAHVRKNQREKIREWYQENKATANAKRRKRYKNDDAYRASQKKRVSESTTRHKNLLKMRQWLSNRINKTKNCLRSLRRFKLEEFREKNRKAALKRFQIPKLRDENLLRSKKRLEKPTINILNQVRSQRRYHENKNSEPELLIQKWRNFLNDSPLQFVCTSCEQLFSRKQVVQYSTALNSIAAMLNSKVQLPNVRSVESKRCICKTCDKNLRKERIPPHSVLNGVGLNLVPDVLKELNLIEEKCVSKRCLFVNIYEKLGEQACCASGIVNLPNSCEKTVPEIPRDISDDLILFNFKRRMSDKKPYISMYGKPSKVLNAARALVGTDLMKLYGVSFNENWYPPVIQAQNGDGYEDIEVSNIFFEQMEDEVLTDADPSDYEMAHHIMILLFSKKTLNQK